MAYIISADDIKKTLPGYTPKYSQDFHKQSTKIAESTYKEALQTRPEQKVVLMAGGTASGKTEYVSEYLAKKDLIIFDGTLPTFTGAEMKIKNAQKYGKDVEIHAVFPQDWRVAFDTFLNRERKMPVESFYHTHSNSRKTLLEVAQKLPDLRIDIYLSQVQFSKGTPEMRFGKLHLDSGMSLVEYLRQVQYTQDAIRREVLL